MSATESRLFADIINAASAKFEPAQSNLVLVNASRQTEVAVAIAMTLQYQIAAAPAAMMMHLRTMARRGLGSNNSTALNAKAPTRMIAET
jgi:hypothetical protein